MLHKHKPLAGRSMASQDKSIIYRFSEGQGFINLKMSGWPDVEDLEFIEEWLDIILRQLKRNARPIIRPLMLSDIWEEE